ncbi:MAG: GAF domain-containing protein [Phycisphaerae bacterium]|nr:GAF domain-containing protein [Phycisphaerae bacterium]
MTDQTRRKRLRSLIRNVNRQRRRQARQIDLLCHDLIGSQRQFIRHLETIGFAAAFYKGLLGVRDLGQVLDAAGQSLREQVPQAHLVFHLRQHGLFRQFAPEGGQTSDSVQLIECFTPELAEGICRTNRTCRLDDLLGLGLQANPAVVSRLSAVTIPLCRSGRSIGFLMACRRSHHPLTASEVRRLSAVAPGLAIAIESCEGAPSTSRDLAS